MLYTHFPSKYASQFALSTFDEPYSALGETNEAVHEMFSDRTNRRTISAVALSSRAEVVDVFSPPREDLRQRFDLMYQEPPLDDEVSQRTDYLLVKNFARKTIFRIPFK
jgi:hypothetical protein